jgi:hypothetical protein
MANTIKHKQSAVPGKVPTAAQLELGELAVNTYDGKVYLKQKQGSVETVVAVQGGGGGGGGDTSTDSIVYAIALG